MRFNQRITLKNGKEAWLRNGDESDGDVVFEIFNAAHAETDYLLSYPDENSFDPQQECQFLKEKTESPNEIEILAVVDRAISLYRGFGFVEFGRNPKGFNSRISGFQELVNMRLEL